MPPQNTESTFTPTPVTVSEQKCAWYQPLCKVTPLSKYLALVIFVVLPFVGGYVGYQVGMQDKESSPRSYHGEVENAPAPAQPTTATSPSNTVSFTPVAYEFPYSSMATKFAKEQNVVRYVADPKNERDVEPGSVPFDYFTEYRELSGATYGDQMAANVSALPYLFMVTSAADYIIFSAPFFKETEGSESGLYKYNVQTKTLTTMKTSDDYRPIVTGGALSPDKTKIAVLNNPWPPKDSVSEPGIGIYYIDLVSDEYVPLEFLGANQNVRFCINEMGCSSKIEWQGNNTVTTNAYHFEKCVSSVENAKDEEVKDYVTYMCSNPTEKVETRTYPIK